MMSLVPVWLRVAVEMVDMLLALVLIEIGLISGLIYLIISKNIEIEDVHDRFDEMQEALTVVAAVLERLPELVPQFSIQQNPFQSLIDAFASKLGARMDSNPELSLRDEEGRFTDGETEEEITTPEVLRD
jgi:predicted RNase H-like HicB family nuclease